MRRRARLYSRQIAIAVVLTAIAGGFLVSALGGPRVGLDAAAQRLSTMSR